MITEERHFRIISLLREKNFAEVSELAGLLGVSQETIRRDLTMLETLGQLSRVRGGAALVCDDKAPASSIQVSAIVPTVSQPVQTQSVALSEPASKEPDCDWFSPTRAPFRLTGFPFFETDGVYRRAPLNPIVPLPKGVEDNIWGSAGGQIRFSADTASVWIRVKLAAPNYTRHNATPLLCSGFDLYASDDGAKTWHFCGTSKFDAKLDCYEAKLFNSPVSRRLDFLINFPIINRVENVLVGLDRGSRPSAPPAFDSDRRILFYGGSIMHGYSATRPGMIIPNIISRRYNHEVVSFGVNGSAKCEDETALTVRSIERVGLFIINTEGNCPTVEWLREHLTSFLTLYRETNPNTVISVMSFMREGREYFDTDAAAVRLAKKQCQSEVVDLFRKKGDDKIFFWDGDEFTNNEEDIVFNGWSAGEECTTDTQHKSDLGFWIMANSISRRIDDLKKREILKL